MSLLGGTCFAGAWLPSRNIYACGIVSGEFPSYVYGIAGNFPSGARLREFCERVVLSVGKCLRVNGLAARRILQEFCRFQLHFGR